MANEFRMYLDKVERKFLETLKAKRPEYSDLELDQIAHLELKEKLLNDARNSKLYKGGIVQPNLRLDILKYKILNFCRKICNFF